MMIRAIIFDCFGVVVTYGFHAAFTAMGGDLERDKQMLQDLFGMYNSGHLSDDELLQKLGVHLGIDTETVKTSLAKDEHIDLRLLERIQELRTNYKIGLLSNIGKGGAERYFADIDTKKYFDDMVLSGEVGLVKPDHRIYELAAERLGLAPSECIFIDDSQRNAEAAEETGMRSIVYGTFEQFDRELNQILSQQ
jgi:epoxide hydrolase-like predicted phosphatase